MEMNMKALAYEVANLAATCAAIVAIFTICAILN
jgi:hypothetical protein